MEKSSSAQAQPPVWLNYGISVFDVAGYGFDFQTATTSVIAMSSATRQSSLLVCCAMDCFAEPVIGRAFARPVGSQ
jgi:hypothetical protein